jgi:hypothetical protein
MNDDRDRRKEPAGAPAGNPKQDRRQDRLKQALRENLKRRKTQARGRSDLSPVSSNSESYEAASSRSGSAIGNAPSPFCGGNDKPDE